MATNGKKAKSVTLGQLSKEVDVAIVKAAERLQIKLEVNNVVFNWQIMGRWLRQIEQERAQELSNALATQLKEDGIEVVPVTVTLGDQTLSGFLDKGGAESAYREI